MDTSIIKELQLGHKDIVRFWTHVDIRGADECWPWTGSTTPKGYGKLNVGGTSYYAHRISLWLLMLGELSPTKAACHRCDNPNCVNPNHLFAGTHSENMKDGVRKGRCGRNFKHIKVGERMAKMVLNAKGTQRDIASRFGISQSNVSRIKSGKIWAN